jgi:hypothetical protein
VVLPNIGIRLPIEAESYVKRTESATQILLLVSTTQSISRWPLLVSGIQVTQPLLLPLSTRSERLLQPVTREPHVVRGDM